MWKPWIGNRFGERRLMLLGESAYSWEDDEGMQVDPRLEHSIQQVQGAIANPTGTNRFFIMVTRALCGCVDPTPGQSEAAWQSVAFTNYVPSRVGYGARVRPSEDQWGAAKEGWPGLLAELQPRRVIVLGKSMWERMPPTQTFRERDNQGYKLADGSFAMCWAVTHPSAAGQSWRRLAEAIRMAEAA